MSSNSFSKQSVAVLLVLLCAQPVVVSAKDDRIIDNSVYTRASVLVNVDDGRGINLYCTGSGKPTVIFEAGLGDSTKAWGLVQPEISKHTKACSYDRAGLGFSDPASVSGTAANAAKDLAQLLQSANLTPPYILVGHSYGALVVKLFTFQNLKSVHGLVLVDPSHEDIGKNLFPMHPEHRVENKKYLAKLKKCLGSDPRELADNGELATLCVGKAGPRYSEAINTADLIRATQQPRIAAWTSEMTHVWVESSDQVRAASRSLGKIPLVLLSREPPQPGPKETVELRERKNAEVARLHATTVALSTEGDLKVIRNTGHYIQLEEPSAVIDAILNIINEYAITHQGDER
jgi:pimeloyl-ACP methyl ester carboxylesterase